MQKPSKLSILFVLDPLEKLNPPTDTSMALLRTFHARGHDTWSVETANLWAREKGVYGRVRLLNPQSPSEYPVVKEKEVCLSTFDLILIRPEPPFDANYLAMTYLMDLLKPDTVLSNDPSAIRDHNEKLSALHFKEFMPESLVTSDAARILTFAGSARKGVVIKPLDLAGGTGVFRLSSDQKEAAREVAEATEHGKRIIMAQKFIPPQKGKRPSDKRAILLNGNFVGVYERRCKEGEFRANLHKGGTYHACTLTAAEKKIIDCLGPFFRRAGLHMVGLDLIQGKLIEINVTCPGGILEAEALYPSAGIIRRWASFLERKAFKRLAERSR